MSYVAQRRRSLLRALYSGQVTQTEATELSRQICWYVPLEWAEPSGSKIRDYDRTIAEAQK